jgi:tetratricopeptide (TPR) repeat protein
MTQTKPDERPSEAELRARLAAGSRDAEDYIELTNLLKEASRYEEAVQIYEQALTLEVSKIEKAKFAWALGEVHEAMGNSADAARLARQTVALLSDEPLSGDTLLFRGLSYSLLARAIWFEDEAAGAEAARSGLQALEQFMAEHGDSPETTMAYYEAARLHNTLSNPGEAIGLCEKYLGSDPSPRDRLAALVIMSQAQQQAGRLAAVEQTVMEALRYAESDRGVLPNLYVTLGLARRDAGRPAEARQAFDEALRALEADPFLSQDRAFLRVIYENLADLHYEARNFAEAISLHERVLTEYPDDGSGRHRALISLGHCYAASGSPDRARWYYEQVLASPVVSDEYRRYAYDALAALPGTTA